jgi:hypothetical protein
MSNLLEPQPLTCPEMCLGCHERAVQVWVDSDANYYRAKLCDVCAERCIAAFGATNVVLGSIARVPLPSVLEGVTLADYAKECLAGVYDSVDLQALWSLPGAVKEVARALSARLRRSLRPSEQVALRIQVTLAYSARRVTATRYRSLAS